MRMMENSHQTTQSVTAYRVMNEHGNNLVVVENVVPDKGGTDEDDEDAEFVDDGEINSRLDLCRANSGEMSASPRSRMEQEKRLRREIANSNERRRMQSINAGFQSLKTLLPRRDGEKMSKASILQQTADFIRRLQLEKELLLQESGEIKQRFDSGGVKMNKTMNEKTPACIPKTETMMNERRCSGDKIAALDSTASPPKKRKKIDNDSADEGVGMMSDAEAMAARRLSPRCSDVGPSSTTATTQTDPLVTADASCCTSPMLMHQPSDTKSIESSLLQDNLLEFDVLQRQLIELRLALDRERRVRMVLEEQIRVVELNHLQALARLQSVPLVDFPPTVGNATICYPHTVPSPLVAVRNQSSVSLLSQPNTVSAAGDSTNLPTPPKVSTSQPDVLDASNQPVLSGSLKSLSNAICSQIIPVAHQQPVFTAAVNPAIPSSPAPSTAKICANGLTPPAYSPASPPEAASGSKQEPPSNANNGGKPYQNPSSKQSLAAIVEAIRHLEGDQLFVDVDLQRSAAHQQSIVVNALVAAAAGQPAHPAVVNSGHPPAMIVRPDHTDSGISSPVSERHAVGGTVAAYGPPAGNNSRIIPSSDGNDNAVAATAMALHNMCFPFADPRQIDTKSPTSYQQQVKDRLAAWGKMAMQQ